ncbi:MAG TPA: FAD binding domain-containing protein [Thermoanaerobaculia bacterium]|nr:FAD binding domain-containing protein [Thermoanaerobaculia bacterium]
MTAAPGGTAADAPRTLADACRRLGDDPNLVPVAGGTDLMVSDRLERSAVAGVLDLTRIPELTGVREVAGGLEIGAATPFAVLRSHPAVCRRFPALAAAAAVVGGWQIQSRATLGGNLVNASPAGDSLPVLLALEAVVVAAGPAGEREIPCAAFHVGYRKTALVPGELVARIRLPDPSPGSRQLFRKVGTREAQAISKVVVAAVGRVGGEGREGGVVESLRLAAGSVAATPVRLRAAEAAAVGKPWSPETARTRLAEEVGRAARGEVTPIDDVRSTAVYRAATLERVVRRLILDLGSPE